MSQATTNLEIIFLNCVFLRTMNLEGGVVYLLSVETSGVTFSDFHSCFCYDEDAKIGFYYRNSIMFT